MTPARRQVTDEERRSRLAWRHLLTPAARAEDPADVAASLVALHATDPVTVYLGARARLRTSAPEDIERALYVDRSVVRLLGMRRTMFVVPVELVAVVQAACASAIATQQRTRLADHIVAGGVTDDGRAWLPAVEDATVAALERLGEATASELGAAVPDLRRQFEVGIGTRWPATQSVASRLLVLLGLEGRIIRGRPRGSWISTQYRWAPLTEWLGADVPALDPAVAQVELARRWLGAFGPGTLADLRWWTGWTAGVAKAALGGLAHVEVGLDGGATGLVLAEEDEPTPAAETWVALLPALDSTVMGWQGRDWYLGDHGPALFDRNGNAGPTVWADGRIVGGWAQRRDGAIALRFLEDTGAATEAAVHDEADRLMSWLGPVRFTPRFRTPLERELSA